MDQPPKPPDGPAVLEELKRALDGAARCIELAKQESARIDAAMRAQPSLSMQVEQELLDNARKRREQLSLSDLRLELPPLPLPDLPGAAPLIREATSVSEAFPSELPPPDLSIVTPKPPIVTLERSEVSPPAPADVPEALSAHPPAPAEGPPPPASLSPGAADTLLTPAVVSPGVAG